MLGKLFRKPSTVVRINSVATLVGILVAIAIDTPRTGTIVFLAVTALESGAFTLLYGLRSDWRQAPAARAVFWAVFAYFAVAAQLITMYLWTNRFWWTDDLRELLYLGLALAGLNLVLVLGRELGPRAYRRRRSS